MSAEIEIPAAVHICPGCEALCWGATYCQRCREGIEAAANFHAGRANQLYRALPRVEGVMPESGKLSPEQWRAVRSLVWNGFLVLAGLFWLLVAIDIFTKWRGL